MPTRRFPARRALAPITLALLLVAVPALSWPSSSAAPSVHRPSTRAHARAVTHIGIVVGDLDRSLDFYTRILTFEKLSEEEHAGADLERDTGVFGARTRTARLRLCDEQIELIEFLASPGRPIPRDSRSNDAWFQHIAIVTPDMDRAYAHLRAHKVRHISTGPQTLPPSLPHAAGTRAFYFADPDGHPLEIINFPPGKGDPRWQVAPDRLFLGIDHTAIACTDTDATIAFYRDTIGLRVAGQGENFGPEQEHLNNVFGARVRITTLRSPPPGGGPGVELLEYLAPRDGRPIPLDTRPNDLWAWRIGLDTDADLARTLLRDPDGHLVSLRRSP
ncbi:MAG: VOC family protein [Phycisphaerales bacterium]|nr:VOC family protein [Phycisphaerales bacterium]